MAAQAAAPSKVDSKAPVKPYQRWLDALSIEAQNTQTSTFDVQMEVAMRILGASDFDSAVEEFTKGILSGKDLVGVEMRILDFTIHEGEIEDADFKFYVKVEAIRLDTGESIVFQVGASGVVSLLWKARQDNELPGEFVIRGKEIGKSKVLLWLERAPKRVVAG